MLKLTKYVAELNSLRYIYPNQICFINTSVVSYQNQTHILHNKTEVKEIDNNKSTKLTEDIRSGRLNISTKTKKKYAQRKPLLKNIFVGIVDTDILAYPEPISRDDLQQFKSEIETSSQYFTNKTYSEQLDSVESIPNGILTDFKDLKLFGINIPQVLGGREYGLTECTMLNEFESEDLNLAQLLNSHRIVSEMILEYGSEKLQQKYLPRLASGEIIGTIAIFESQLTEDGLFNTKATLDSTETFWKLNGEKSFVLNAPSSSLYLVFTKTIGVNNLGDVQEGISAFLVEGNSLNLLKSEPNNTFGCDKIKQSSISFNNVEIPFENLLGKLNGGSKIAQHILNIVRFQSGTLSTIGMKNVLKDLTNYSVNTNVMGTSVMEMELIKERLGKMAYRIYAAESMVHMTSSLVDLYDNQDVEIESAALKIFASENFFKMATEACFTKGQESLFAKEYTEKMFRDSAHLLITGEKIDTLKLLVGLSGLQHAGLHLNDTVKKERNPLFYPEFIFGRLFNRRNFDDPKLTLKLFESLHPTLNSASNWLEASILRVQLATDILLARHGPEIIKKEIEVVRIAESVILIYAMFCAIARASRSYCIGTQFSDYEMLTASAFAMDASEIVKQLTIDIAKGPFMTMDDNLLKLSKQVLKNKGYLFVHPTTYNY